MMRHVAKVALDAHGRIGHGDADLKTTPDDWRRPVSGEPLGRGQMLSHVVFQVVAVRLERPGHDGEQLHLLLHQLASGQWRRGIARRVEQRSKVREIADLHKDDRAVRLAAEYLPQQGRGFRRIRATLEAMRVAELLAVLDLGQRQELAWLVGQAGVRKPDGDARLAIEGVHGIHERPGQLVGLRDGHGQ